MSEINRALGVHGAGFPLNVDGKEYRLYPLPVGMQGEMEAQLEAVQWQRFERLKQYMTDEERASFQSSLVKRIMDGEFHFSGPKMAEWLQTPDGLTLWVSLMLKVKHPDISESELQTVITHVAANPDALESLYPKTKAPKTATGSGATH